MYHLVIFVDLAYSEHAEAEMLAVFTYADELGFEPGLNSPEFTGTVSGDVKQSKQHKTISFMGALRGLVSSPMQLQKDSPPSSRFLSLLREKSSSNMFQDSSQLTSLGDSSQRLPLYCQTAESSPHSPYLNQFGSERDSSDEIDNTFENTLQLHNHFTPF